MPDPGNATPPDDPQPPRPAPIAAEVERRLRRKVEGIVERVLARDASADAAVVRKAFEFAFHHHETIQRQRRKTGEPYIIHPVEVTEILASLEVDTATIAAGLLHDVVEDCNVTREEIAENFSEEIATLVDGVTKLKLADFERLAPGLAAAAAKEAAGKENRPPDPRRRKRTEERSSAENLRKILLAMARDLRVMVVKLADRLHNMRTIVGLAPERRRKVAEETMQVFAPLAARLGIWQIKWQLEDLAFKVLEPDAYRELTERIARTRRDRELDIREAIDTLRAGFLRNGLEPEIQGRPKHLWSIHNKMRSQELDLPDIYDLIALRVIVDSIPECYAALGVVHDTYLPIPGKFDDYIAMRKSNGYQSLHTKVYGPRGEPLEVQIRTWEMHKTAEFGVAAHWAYKEQGENARGDKGDFDRKMAFLRRQLFEWQQDARDTSDFLSQVSTDLFTSQVFVFTPKGDVIDLPAGATPIDFAFRIHTDVGEHLAVVRVNGKTVPLSHRFENGDICQVITRPGAGPSLDWLSIAKSSHAKSKIKHYFRLRRYDDSVAKGRDLLHDELVRLGIPLDVLRDARKLKALAREFNKEEGDDLLAAIGFGDTPLGAIVHKIRPEEAPASGFVARKPGEGRGSLSIAASGVDGVSVRRAHCCLPLPGDTVVGYVSRGRGVQLHREGCPNVAQWRAKEPERLIPIDWPVSDRDRFSTGVVIETLDRHGLVRDVTDVVAGTETFIIGIHTYSHREAGTATLRIDLESPSLEHLEGLIRRLQSIPDLVAVYRLGVAARAMRPPSTSAP
ncbi:MAG: RelA/SpoT family protein [Armatimonadota bacterium]